MIKSKNNNENKEYNFKEFEAEQLKPINKIEVQTNKEEVQHVKTISNETLLEKNNKSLNETPKYLQERTIFLMDNDNKILFNKFVQEKQWTKSQALNYIIRTFLKNQN